MTHGWVINIYPRERRRTKRTMGEVEARDEMVYETSVGDAVYMNDTTVDVTYESNVGDVVDVVVGLGGAGTHDDERRVTNQGTVKPYMP